MGEPQLPSVTMWYWEAVVFLILSSPSIASLCSKGRREEGGRASFLAQQLPGARVQTYLLSWEGASLRWEGKKYRQSLLTHPNTALLAQVHVKNGLCKWIELQFPGRGCWEAGTQVGSRWKSWWQTGTLRAAKQNPPARREDAAESGSKLPSSSSEGFQQRWGWRWMMSLSPVQEMCWVVRGPTDAMQPMREACTPARCLGLSSWFLFFWFMQRKGAQRHDPSRVGGLMGCLRCTGGAVVCVR